MNLCVLIIVFIGLLISYAVLCYKTKIAIIQAIRKVYKYSHTGSALHIVIDDNNASRRDIKWCIKNTIPLIEDEEERKACERCAEMLLCVRKSTREYCIKNAFKF